MAVWYREIGTDGALSPLVRVGQGKAGASYPTVALGMSGRVFLGWTETGPAEPQAQSGPQAMMLRGRIAAEVAGR